ncbi:MAG: transcription-repair coupling factor [Deltaproteobacteria bacterium]|nr:transcription-repair coupling factor [Deltaproteobacteria bacterium]
MIPGMGENSPFQPLFDFLEKRGPLFYVYGLKGSSPAYLLSRVARRRQNPILVLTASEEKAERFFQELLFFIGDSQRVFLYPSWDLKPFEKISPPAEVMGQQWNVRHHLISEPGPAIVVASLEAVLQRIPPRQVLQRFAFTISPNQEFQREELISRLEGMGYGHVNLVAEMGEFAVRGYLVDVFSPATPAPLRVEFLEDRVESVRTFDPDSQRSSEALERALILPVREALFFPEFIAQATSRLTARLPTDPDLRKSAEEVLEKIRQGIPFPGVEFYQSFFYSILESFFDYLPPSTAIFLEEPPELEGGLNRFWEEARGAWEDAFLQGEFWPAPAELYLSNEEFSGRSESFSRVAFQALETGVEDRALARLRLETDSHERLRSDLLSSKSEEGVLRLLAQRIRTSSEKGISTLHSCSSLRSAQRLEEMLERHDLSVQILKKSFSSWTAADSQGWDVTLFIGDLSRGFIFQRAGLMLITESELFGEKRPRKRPAVPLKDHALAAFSELKVDDYVVHADHGIGIYRGLLKFKLGDEEHDFLLIEYQGGDKLYLPVYRLNLVQKYVGGGESQPRMDKLGGTSWEKAKKRVKNSLRELAEELVKLYAIRAVIKGHAFSPVDDLLKEFEASFEYEETLDQMQAIEDVMADMGGEKPMDRLICGDVGFGKTEVAMRASFRAMMDGKQVAVLVPTTVLAQQHYQTFSGRFAPCPFRVEMLSRFRSLKEQKQVLEDLGKGKIDLVIGTHRLLQRDVAFKDLGLLVVDEEHRFGVKHKERLKRLRSNVDVLTLTATPIPRTLQMSLGGIRDLSVIETPPEDRLAIRTYVTEFDEEVIRDAIRRELRRGGQIFFVHNRVQSIPAMEKFLRRLVPEARLAIAHGQMAERDLERVMLAFVKKEINLLLTTTIIESGLDFPAANTIVINRADKLGLAQMYQLRGRVGRSKERAYAYLLVPGLAAMGQDARKRLEALQEVTELGLGLKLAMHDLEIRGAGTLLGDAQSGHIAAVGYDMYLQILEQAVQELKGEEVVEEVEPEIDLPIPAFIPADYVEDINQRLIFYRRFSSARSEKEVEEIGEELRDRFGPMPPVLINLLQVMDLKLLLKRAGVRRVYTEKEKVILAFDSHSSVDPARLVAAVVRGGGKREFTPDGRLKIRVGEKGWSGMVEETRKLLLEVI